jgi:hypothetical protein
MKKLFTLLFVFAIAFGTIAKPIKVKTALEVAANYLKLEEGIQVNSGNLSALAIHQINDNSNSIASVQKDPALYAVNGSFGFVLIAGDDAALPIIGYVPGQKFINHEIPSSIAKWFNQYVEQISFIRIGKLQANSTIQMQWKKYVESSTSLINSFQDAQVAPLVKTQWDQRPYVNDDCPYDNTAKERTVSGCVATSMAQIMKFWDYPKTGKGFHSYSHSKYGLQSANFGNTTYNWTSMPNKVTSTNSAVAQLMYHCGVSVDMNYGIGSTGGSGAYVINSKSPVTHCSEYAFETYFDYKTTLKGVERANYTTATWTAALKAELDAGRPILYAGFGGGGGHAWVCDGYDANDKFHMNWGWGGVYDGYFSIDALNPSGVGTGGGTGGFNAGHQAVIGIEPTTPQGGGGGSTEAEISMYSAISPSVLNIAYGASISLGARLANLSSNNFSGSFAAAVFDADGVFVDFVETITGMSLQAGFAYNNNTTFSNTGLLSLLPGSYTVGLYYKNGSNNWKVVKNNGSFINAITLNVINNNPMYVYEKMVVENENDLKKGDKLKVTLDIANTTGSTFNGTYDVSLYNLQGEHEQTIETKSSQTLCNNCHYTSGLDFETSEITVEPGTYLLALLHKDNSAATWSITGSNIHVNPIKVTIKASSLPKDIYEDNNSTVTAFKLNLSFNGNNASAVTTGSNCHVGNDYDYYRIQLESGYTYDINARLYDLDNNNTQKDQTLDALFSYSVDGTGYSSSYDYLMPQALNVPGGRSVYFKVSPYFTGDIGTYYMSINVTRKASLDVKSLSKNEIKVYPNPTRNFISIDHLEKSASFEIIDISGKVVSKGIVEPGMKLDVQSLLVGMYQLKLITDQKTEVTKFQKY